MPLRPPKNGSDVFGAATVWPRSTFAATPPCAGVRDVPHEQPEQGEHDGGRGGADGAHQTM